MFIWHEKSPSLKRANWLIRRQLFIIDYILTETGLAVVTDEGEVFVCTVSNKTSTPLKECAQHNSKGKLLCPNISAPLKECAQHNSKGKLLCPKIYLIVYFLSANQNLLILT